MHHHIARWALSLTLAAATGCATTPGWKPLPPPPATFARAHPEEVRVTLADGSHVMLTFPHLAGDTLLGWRDPFRRDTPVRIPVAEVRAIEQWRGPAASSADRHGAGGGGFAAGGILLFLASFIVGTVLVLVACGNHNCGFF